MSDGVANYQAVINASIYCIGAFTPTTLKASKAEDEVAQIDVDPATENTSAVKTGGPVRNMEVTLTHDFPAGQKCAQGMLIKTQATGTEVKLDPLEISIHELGNPL